MSCQFLASSCPYSGVIPMSINIITFFYILQYFLNIISFSTKFIITPLCSGIYFWSSYILVPHQENNGSMSLPSTTFVMPHFLFAAPLVCALRYFSYLTYETGNFDSSISFSTLTSFKGNLAKPNLG
jgi:hypothetical protein